MSDLTKKLEVTANIAIIVSALLVGAVFVKSFLMPAPPPPGEITAGTNLSVPGVTWNDGKTLLLVLSQECRYCTESAPFYQRLVRETRNRTDVQLVAVVPQTREEGQNYLRKLGVEIPNVMHSPLRDVGVMGTPTLILVDAQGVVIRSWVGLLPASREAEVLKQLKS